MIHVSAWTKISILFLLVGLFSACNSNLESATLQLMDSSEALWQADPVSTYSIVVEVDRPSDRRRNFITVEKGQVVQATVSYWNAESKQWDTPYDLNQEQAFPFTVPGLFDMVRGEIRGSGRGDIRVQLSGDPPFPRLIVLGPVLLNGQPVGGTEATVIVDEFEPAAP